MTGSASLPIVRSQLVHVRTQTGVVGFDLSDLDVFDVLPALDDLIG